MISPSQLHRWILLRTISLDLEDSRWVSSWSTSFADPRGCPVYRLVSSGELSGSKMTVLPQMTKSQLARNSGWFPSQAVGRSLSCWQQPVNPPRVISTSSDDDLDPFPTGRGWLVVRKQRRLQQQPRGAFICSQRPHCPLRNTSYTPRHVDEGSPTIQSTIMRRFIASCLRHKLVSNSSTFSPHLA